MPEPGLRWHAARLVAGYGVASGQALDSPYPAGTIALQAPLFARHGIDLSAYYPGTLNLSFAESRWVLNRPDARVEQLRWTEHHPPETFSFWRVALRWRGLSTPVEGLLYWPHPETKQRHQHGADRLEVLAPWIGAPAQVRDLELGVDPRRCRRVQPLRLQARLLEALKFRVLAAQEAFFTPYALGDGDEPLGPWPQGALFRQWLASVQPEALDLSDAELHRVLKRALSLYCEDPIGSNRDNGRGPSELP